ncbi:DUF72 domain-containing protein [Marinactinospora thermotolerans]|uniref:Uncharacterized conserved protein YecE, DUF72 family n=1 Tax=Marinactinospora thermotolerans DSM 45154 TaxID=1122192 RepID=A0A1T4SGN8_9ACTN|nr:DUF72 domain-containing protein [Marinactinospora thermotolerans]SKA27392.1 Uncharacterized conserved protein YecE, DUF72 family [Marinactinospora thermotolerans DSM 45154]
MGHIRIGTASWTDRSLVESGWYPPQARTPEQRLRFYASRFPVVEVDATYYHPPAERTSLAWVERTPPDFVFNVKAFSLFTHHPTRPSALPVPLRAAAAKSANRNGNLYVADADPGLVTEMWDRFRTALAPLQRSGKLGAVLLQFPPWFPAGAERRRYILECRERCAPMRVCVEFRHASWLREENREETLRFLVDNDLPYVCVDMPQGHTSSVPPLAAVTSPDLAVVRFHGRSRHWDSGDKRARFAYRYDDAELSEWVPRIRHLADEAAAVHVVMNNCNRDWAQRNAERLAELLGEGTETIVPHAGGAPRGRGDVER